MIAINLIVPYEDVSNICDQAAEDFEVIEWASDRNKRTMLFRINTTEERVTFLKLKYGMNKVWIR